MTKERTLATWRNKKGGIPLAKERKGDNQKLKLLYLVKIFSDENGL